MKVLIACEFTGTVRDAFLAQGHDAWSCDILPTERRGPHIVNDVRNVLCDGWDLMIAHPPCQYLSFAANHCWNKPGRDTLRHEAMQFFLTLVHAPIPCICIENPVGYPNQVYRKPDQIVHPYYFGDRQLKRTCLWLKGLPKLWYWTDDDLFGTRTITDYPEPVYSTQRKTGGGKSATLFRSQTRQYNPISHVPRYRQRDGGTVEQFVTDLKLASDIGYAVQWRAWMNS